MALSHSSSADSISEVHSQGTDDTHNVSRWREVLPGDEIPFEFEAREKLRHRCDCDACQVSDSEGVVGVLTRWLLLALRRHTHELKLHQLLVRVCGWEQVKPVSVDKVGVFFRYAAADRNNASNTASPAVLGLPLRFPMY